MNNHPEPSYMRRALHYPPTLDMVSKGFLWIKPRYQLYMPYRNKPGMSFLVGEFRDLRMGEIALERLTREMVDRLPKFAP